MRVKNKFNWLFSWLSTGVLEESRPENVINAAKSRPENVINVVKSRPENVISVAKSRPENVNSTFNLIASEEHL